MSGKIFAISAIVLVAVVMGLSTIAPALQQAFAHNVGAAITPGFGQCPNGFAEELVDAGTHPDHNFNGKVCFKIVGSHRVVIDDPPIPT